MAYYRATRTYVYSNFSEIFWSKRVYIKAVDKTYLRKKFRKIPLKYISSIGIDDIHMGKRIAEKGYLTIVRDLKSDATLFVGKRKIWALCTFISSNLWMIGLVKFEEELPESWKMKIREICKAYAGNLAEIMKTLKELLKL